MPDLRGFPFESNFIKFDDYGLPIFSHAISSAVYRQILMNFYTDGVFFNPSTNFQVTAIGGMDVEVEYGTAFIKGLTVTPGDAARARFSIPPSSPTADRVDLIVLRADFTATRSVTIHIKQGASTAADLQRDAAVWELGLASILIRRNVTAINQSDITDLRLNSAFCGVVTEPIIRTNTDAFFAQLQASLALNEQEWAEFHQSALDSLAASEQQWADALTYNEQQWADFYGRIEGDISVLLERAVIRIDQVTGLQAALDAVPVQLEAQNVAVQEKLDAQEIRVNDALAAKAARTVQLSATVAPSLWLGDVAPFTATVPVSGVSVNAIARAGLSDTATAVEREASRNAAISPVSGNAVNTVKLVADGEKPMISLPIIVTIWG